MRGKTKKINRFVVALIVVIIVIAILKVFFPIVSCKIDVPDDVRTRIEEHSQKVYSPTFPLLPVYINIDQFESDRYFYSVYYFPFGVVRMSLAEDGFYMEETLTGSTI